IDSIATLVRTQYVSADTGKTIANYLIERQRTGAYDTLETPRFAAEVTKDLRSINGDKHLAVVISDPAAPPPNPGAAAGALGRVAMLADSVGLLTLNRISAPTPEGRQAVDEAMVSLRNANALIIDLRGNPGGAGQMNDYLW